jgi:hypothetical protein
MTPEQIIEDLCRERVILGPCVCQGCGLTVVYLYSADSRPLGWLHPTGNLACVQPKGPRPGQRKSRGIRLTRMGRKMLAGACAD